ncbi:MAG: efflux RND transporter periplasmic adaptor subunit [Acidobacteriota bacterium]
MLHEERQPTQLSNHALGDNFQAQSSPSYGGELGTSFEERNSSREEWEKEKHRGRRMWIWIGLLTLAVVIALIVYISTRPKPGAPGTATEPVGRGGRHGQSGPASITVGKSTTGDINIYIKALGTVTPLNTATIYSQITGKVLAVHYKEGQLVHKGQPLIDIDPEPYIATLTQAQGTLRRDQGVLAQAEMDLKRYQDALAKNAIARQQVEDQEKIVEQDHGTVTTDEGTLAYDKVQLAYCHIVAPITGRVGLRLVDPGNTVFSGTGSTLLVITQLQPITVVFNVSEDDLPQVQQQLGSGHALGVDAFDRGDQDVVGSGKLTSLDNQIDTTTGTLKFRATFPNNKMELFPNQFVNARLKVKTLTNATLVPSGAVQYNGTNAFVYVIGQAHKNMKDDTSPMVPVVNVQPVTVITSDENVAAVTGVHPGEQLATSGFDRLEGGAQVNIQTPGGGPGGGQHGRKGAAGQGGQSPAGHPPSAAQSTNSSGTSASGNKAK